MPDSNKTEIVVLMDRSGSMADMKSDMEKGFETLRQTQLDGPGECSITLVQFDTGSVDTLYVSKPVKDVPRLVLLPRGGTPLLDAFADTIISTGKRLSALDESKRPGKVIFVTLTDGEENSSTRFTKRQCQDMAQEQREKYSWQFIYLGAEVDKFDEQASSIGTYTVNAASYDKSNATANFAMLGQKINTYRVSNVASSLDYTDEDRAKLLDNAQNQQ